MSSTGANVRLIVGLEIHVQLLTRSKMFCACPVRFDAPPNSCVCPVCLGLPGALPVINRHAVDHALLTGLALGCRITPTTRWDRKSYYYPDLPKNYQISQYDLPIATEGRFEFDVDGRPRSVRIRRAHLEEDAGKNLHDATEGTLVDLNRAGTPLLEIVTEPDLASPDDVYVFCTELQRLVIHLGVAEASMQKGQMRFEPNVNLAIQSDGGEVRTPIVEIKNLNSFRSVRLAVAYEAQRQLHAWQQDHDYVFGVTPNENRGWNEERGVTEFQRGKEAAHDYRYFPDPDLPPVRVTEDMLADVRRRLCELPVLRRRRLVDALGLSASDAETLMTHRPTADLFDRVVSLGADPTVAGKQFVNIWLGLANARGVAVTDLPVDADRMAELARMSADGTVNRSAANQLAEVMLQRPEPPHRLADELGLLQTRDTDATAAWVEQAFAENEKALNDALGNPKKAQAAAGFLRGQVMKLSGGKADPRLVGRLIEERLSRLRNPA